MCIKKERIKRRISREKKRNMTLSIEELHEEYFDCYQKTPKGRNARNISWLKEQIKYSREIKMIQELYERSSFFYGFFSRF